MSQGASNSGRSTPDRADVRLDVLVVSHSCVMAVNRAPYRELAKAGLAVAIVAPEEYQRGTFRVRAEPPQSADPPLFYLGVHGSHPRLLVYEGLSGLLHRLRPRIIVLDADPGSRVAISSGVWANRNGAKLVCISCDNMSRTLLREAARGCKALARFLATRALLRASTLCVDHVFALSTEIREVVEGYGFQGRATMMPLGFDPVIFHPDHEARARIRAQLGLRDFTFAYFGRLSPEKGVHVLFDALGGLREQPWQLVIDEFRAYTHPYAETLRRMASSLGIADRIVFFDAHHDEMGEYMNAVDAVVVPSVSTTEWKEQYGRVAPEAMACGRAVVVSTSGALAELVGDAGLVFAEGDVSELRVALVRLMEEPALLNELGEKALARAHSALSVAAQCRVMLRVFESLRTGRTQG